MKKIITAIMCSVLLSCSTDYKSCPGHNEHNWHTSLDFNGDGWYEERCTNCDLQRKSSINYLIHGKSGSVYVYYNPNTQEYDDYYAIIFGEDGNTIKIKPTDIKKR